jgi:hypothetical protein
VTIVETFSLKDVPREALYVGLAGVIPYLATSLSTVYLSFDIQYAAMHGQGFLMSGETAEKLLHIIEPIQLGYGASVGAQISRFIYPANDTRSFPSSEPSTGVLNGLALVAIKAIPDTRSASLLPQWPGPHFCFPLRSD